jgi:vacuolar iron transporter family protein
MRLAQDDDSARVTFWGALAMALTAGIGAVFGTVV